MYPVLLQIGTFQISTYGFMLMMAFIVNNYLLKKYLISIGKDGTIAEDIIFYAAIGGIIGAKIFYIVEYYDTDGYRNVKGLISIFKGLFTLDLTLVLSGINKFGSGLVFLGGLFGGLCSVTYYVKKNNLSWLKVSDWVAPYIILGQGIGRLGCFFVGCCYGKPTNIPWLFSFSNGRPPTTYESFQYNHPEIFDNLVKPFYSFGDFIKVHPTQLYEFSIYFIIFVYLIKIRPFKKYDGQIFLEYIFLAGFSRFIIEFLRLNPSYMFSLSSAQLISIFMIILSTFLMYLKRYKYQND
tara:strand:+ start:7632 stop:8516 length:885 start_codon:yes stop_codon:yes gene_type:complete